MDETNDIPEKRDEFPEKRKLGPKKIDEEFNVKHIQPITSKVVDFLMSKALHEKRKQDQYNPTMLGNVLFHIHYNDITKEARLVFDKHPKMWKIKEIMEDLDRMDADIMTDKWAGDQMSMNDNPFTF